MPDPISIGVIILACKVIAVIIALLIITYQSIIDWFQEQEIEELVQSDMDYIPFTFMEHFETGNYSLVQGVFNKRTEKVVEGRKLQSKHVDNQVAALHRDKVLAIYT